MVVCRVNGIRENKRDEAERSFLIPHKDLCSEMMKWWKAALSHLVCPWIHVVPFSFIMQGTAKINHDKLFSLILQLYNTRFCVIPFFVLFLPWHLDQQRSDGDIMIRNIQLRHAGKYTCAVQTKVDSISIATDVVVRGKGKKQKIKPRYVYLITFFFQNIQTWTRACNALIIVIV